MIDRAVPSDDKQLEHMEADERPARIERLRSLSTSRTIVALVGVAVLVAAVVVALSPVSASGYSCGSVLVVKTTDRESKWLTDTFAAAIAHDQLALSPLYNTDKQPSSVCPDAVSQRTWIAAALLTVSVLTTVGGAFLFGPHKSAAT